MDILSAISFIAERKIEDAIAEGQLDNLPGMGLPLEVEDLSHLPPDMRMAYTILKNSGYIDTAPQKGEALSMKELLSSANEERACYSKMQRLKVMMARVERSREAVNSNLKSEPESPAASDSSPYLEKILSRV